MKKRRPSKKDAIAKVMEEFDFERVHNIMLRLNWNWFPVRDAVPSIPELKRTARQLLVDVCEEDVEFCGTGGFEAYWHKEDEDMWCLSLRFVVESVEVPTERDLTISGLVWGKNK